MALTIYIFVMGTVFGSFLNVLIDRLPLEQSIGGRSHCDNCKKTLGFWDLFPVLSFIWIRGKCRYCGTKLSWFYPGFEILTGIIFVLTWYYFPSLSLGISTWQWGMVKICNVGLISTILVILFADWKYHIIPDSMQVSLFVFTLAKYLLMGLPFMLIGHQLLAGLAIMAPILALYLGTRGRGMGFGDVKLAFNMGFILGIVQGGLALYIGFVTGSVYGLSVILLKRKKFKSAIAFGPFLLLGLVIMMIWGDYIATEVRYFYGFYP